MKKYRVITDGTSFRVQRKEWVVFYPIWIDQITVKSLEAAIKYIGQDLNVKTWWRLL